eukprot:COSAG01_NODE_3342_length_6229_cov_4.142088_2_plen_354_part_00
MRCRRAHNRAASAVLLLVLGAGAGVVSSSAAAATAGGGAQKPLLVVNLTHPADSDPTFTAAFAAAGLANRDGANVYVLRDDDPTSDGALSPRVASRTAFWLRELVAPKRLLTYVEPDAFVKTALAEHGAVVYDSTREPWAYTSALTLAGVYAAVPVDVSLLPAFSNSEFAIKFNTTARWQTKEDAVQFCLGTALRNTTSLVINSVDDMHAGKLADFIVAQRLFVLGSPRNATWCAAGSADHRILRQIVDRSHWPKPVRVYGYNHEAAGSLFEAETNCLNTLAALISGGTANIPFWQAFEPLAPSETLTQPTQPAVAYNESKTYVGLLMSDMDNLDFVQVSRCAIHVPGCARSV